MDQNPTNACTSCGAELSAEAVSWCPACGASLSADNVTWEIAGFPPVVGSPGPLEARPLTTGWAGLFAACGAFLKGLAARPKALVAVALACLVVLAGIGAGAYFLATRGGADYLYPVLVDGKTGFIDRSGQMVIEPRQEGGWEFSSGLVEGRARMFVDGKWGFIDSKGDYVIPLQYDRADDFSEGLAAVWQGTQLIYVDRTGNVAIEVPGMTEGGRFSEGLAAFGTPLDSGSNYGYIDKRGNVIISPRFVAVGEFSEGLAAVEVAAPGDAGYVWGYIDKTGTWVIEPEFTWAGPFSEGLAAVRKFSQDFGYIDKTGAWAIHPEPSGFLYAGSFLEGLACVYVMAGEFHDTPKFGFIDKSGKTVIEPAFDTPGYFSQGRAAMGVLDENGGVASWGYIDKSGARVVEPTYLKAGPFQPGGLAAVVRSGSAWMLPDPPDGYLGVWSSHLNMVDSGPPDIAYIDKSGKVVWAADTETTTVSATSTTDSVVNPGELYPVYVDDKVGYISANGAMVIEPQAMDGFSFFSEGLARISQYGSIAYLNQHGEWLIPVADAVDAGDFSEGLAYYSVMENGTQKYGYVDSSGAVIIRSQFAAATAFSDGLAAVQQMDGRWGYIDKQGVWIIEPTFVSAGAFSEGLAPVGQITYGGDGRDVWGYIDKTGSWVIEPGFVYAGPFSEGLAPVQLMEYSGRLSPIGFIDTSGRVVIQPAFAVVGAFCQGLAAACSEFDERSWGYIDKTGAWVLAPQYKLAGPYSEEGVAMVVRAGELRSQLPWETYPEGRWAGLLGLSSYFDDRPVDMAYIDKTGKVIWETLHLPGLYD